MITVLFSGGVDSWVNLNWAVWKFGAENVRPVYYDVGQKYAEREMWTAAELCGQLGMQLDKRLIADLHERENGFIPLRNLTFIFNVALDETCTGVVFGMLRGEYACDKTPKFIRRVQMLLDSQLQTTLYDQGREFRIYTPFSGMTKNQMVKWFLDHIDNRKWGVRQLLKTQACYRASSPMCGSCQSCFNRWVAFTLNDIHEEYEYEVHPAHAFLDKVSKGVDKSVLFNPQARGRIRWAWEVIRALDVYTRKNYQHGVLKELAARW